MGEEFYCVLKLVTGEEIFSLIMVDENDGDPIIILQNPVIMKMFYNHTGSHVKIKPWMEIPDDDIFLIKLDKVVTMTEVKDNIMIGFYEQYLKDDGEEYVATKDGQVKISNKMGYISSVEDARKRLENLFKDFKES
jgi:hypothetical protein